MLSCFRFQSYKVTACRLVCTPLVSSRSHVKIGALGQHDVGGNKNIDEVFDCKKTDVATFLWEKQVHSVLGLISKKGYISVDELRKGIEDLPSSTYVNWSYYGKWAASMANALLQRNILNQEDVDTHIYGNLSQIDSSPFAINDLVRVREENFATLWQRPHLRTPGYIFGIKGNIERVVGDFNAPHLLASRQDNQKQTLYRVRFFQKDIWDDYAGCANDTIDVEIFHPWLEPVKAKDASQTKKNHIFHSENTQQINNHHDHHHEHDHDHDHDHDHVHLTREETEQKAVDDEGVVSQSQMMAEGFIRAVLAKKIVTAEELRAAVEAFEEIGVTKNGARLVARSWIDSEFKERLLKDGNAAALELGIVASPAHAETKLVAVESTEKVHNLIVCTLCSCYPIALLGQSPAWYKSRSYRARAVREPREVLKEFGTGINENVDVRVHDSTADCRYMVIPKRPANTESMTEEELVEIVTRDSMIGVTNINL